MASKRHQAWRKAMRSRMEGVNWADVGTVRLPGTGGPDAESEAVRAWARDQEALEAQRAALARVMPKLRAGRAGREAGGAGGSIHQLGVVVNNAVATEKANDPTGERPGRSAVDPSAIGRKAPWRL
jgi:hypothetical protein